MTDLAADALWESEDDYPEAEIDWSCLDCSDSTFHEYYSLQDTVWLQALLDGPRLTRALELLAVINGPWPRFRQRMMEEALEEYCTLADGFLCIGCLETRLARRLTPKDFTDAPINDPDIVGTERLRSRILGLDEESSASSGYDLPMPDLTLRRQIFTSGEVQPNGISGEESKTYYSGGHSIGLSVLLAQTLKKRGLGSIGVALTLLDRKPLWAFTSVGFIPEDKSGGLVTASGDGIFIGVEGSSILSSWPGEVRTDEGIYRTYWLPPVGSLPIWKKLAKAFPEGDWKTPAQKVADQLYSSHREAYSSHWIPLGIE